MPPPLSPLTELHAALTDRATTPLDVANASLARVNGNRSRNTYLHLDAPEVLRQAESLPDRFPDPAMRPPLYGVPVSLKDCFDLARTVTSLGSRFYATHRAPATEDSALATRLRQAGAILIGKTHLHPLAYGITGENPDYGDCLQPGDPSALTGGSSSGAAASILEGSALVAIGTDTGGSIRVPAALCGLVGYRASHSLAAPRGPDPGLWSGATHLASSFDTPGILLRDPRDLPIAAHVLFGIALGSITTTPRIAFVDPATLHDCEPDILRSYELWQARVSSHASTSPSQIELSSWRDSVEIFAGIQAHEAAAIHQGHFDQFEPSIAQRLHWGSSLSPAEVTALRLRHREFKSRLLALFEDADLLALPCAPLSRLPAGEDLTQLRPTILRYTTPFSLAGLPVLSLPGRLIGAPHGTGIQIAAAPGRDSLLLAFGAALAEQLQ